MKKGYIALDIDGTITGEDGLIPDETAAYLTQLHRQGWQLVLLTGRMFSFAMRSLTKFSFPFYLGVQNGADLIRMPEREVVGRNYLTKETALELDKICQKERASLLLYAGFDGGDFCYYRPQDHGEEMLDYFKVMERLAPEPWQQVSDFMKVEQEAFPLFKVLGPRALLELVEQQLLKNQAVETAIIKDPFHDAHSVMLVTAIGVNKGETLKTIHDLAGINGPTIAAGDDENDISLLQAADIGIAMAKAPESVKRVATIVAQNGPNSIIAALNNALRSVQ